MFSGEIESSLRIARRDGRNRSRLRENPSARPPLETVTIVGGVDADVERIVVKGVKEPLTPFHVVRFGGHRTIGGGTSDKAISRARRKMAANGRS